MRIVNGLMLVCVAAGAAPIHASECPRTPLDGFVEQGRDLLIGEQHGTAEAPALVRCLVSTALAREHAEPLVVSIEHTPGARDLSGSDWKSRDGRSSIALWELAKFLSEQEKLGRLKVAFHMPVIRATRPEDIPDSATYEKLMGTPLRELAQQNQLIALVGNVHSRKTRPDWIPYDPAGVYVGDAAVHVAVEATGPGTAWSMQGRLYELRATPAGWFAGQEPGRLVDGKAIEHDYVYLVPRFTASGPRFP
jgi:hypothetical protein